LRLRLCVLPGLLGLIAAFAPAAAPPSLLARLLAGYAGRSACCIGRRVIASFVATLVTTTAGSLVPAIIDRLVGRHDTRSCCAS
jgi:hypothetical protein